MGKRIDITGQKFGRLTVLECAGASPAGARWKALCDCGQETIVDSYKLRTGDTKSCGCWNLEAISMRRFVHGKSHTRIHNIWQGMLNRCRNQNAKSYADYGAKGIRVCERWQSFENFYEDMGDPPDGHTIERTEVFKDYSPDNCVWIPKSMQGLNTSKTIYVTAFGQRRPLHEFIAERGLPRVAVWLRIFRRGWDVERALTTPIS